MLTLYRYIAIKHKVDCGAGSDGVNHRDHVGIARSLRCGCDLNISRNAAGADRLSQEHLLVTGSIASGGTRCRGVVKIQGSITIKNNGVASQSDKERLI